MNSNIFSFDFDTSLTSISEQNDLNLFDGYAPKESHKRPASSSLCDPIQYFADGIQFVIDEIDAGESTPLQDSPYSSRQSSIQSIDTSCVEDDTDVPQFRSRDMEDRSMSVGSAGFLNPFDQELCVPKRPRRSLVDAEQNNESNVDYLKLLADARRVIDSMSSTIQVMSTRMTKLQRHHHAVDMCFQNPESYLTPVSEEPVLNTAEGPQVTESHQSLEWDSTSEQNSYSVESPQWSESESSPFPTPIPETDVPHTEVLPMSSIELKISSAIEPLWYAERPYPPFTVDVVDSVSQRKVLANGWKVMVDMVDGFNNSASDKLSGTGQYPGHQFPVVNGTATISGIRFRAVSSKCGGFFRIIVSVSYPTGDQVPKSVFTSNIQVLSYRLYHAPKVPFESLRPDDSVSKIKGIGSLYAKRLQALGIERVSQLAAIDVNTIGESGVKLLLGTIRKDRGAMTMTRLTDYIQQARTIVARSPAYAPQVAHTHTVARPVTSSEKREPNQHFLAQPVTLWSALNTSNSPMTSTLSQYTPQQAP
eukprot:c1880_g1_i1.p1 GENE.c1880_g1_i1~~c1880_g1_i1.p1  ORF type:complete len:534 (+),score=76.95 c1880_g1_i1:125-1726(+)